MEQPRERFIPALERRPIEGRVPTLELVFFLMMEKFGRVHPSHRLYDQWNQMSKKEQDLHRDDMARLFIETAAAYGHDAIFVHPNPGSKTEILRLLTRIRELSGDRYFLMLHGDATFSIPDGNHMAEFTYRLADEPESVHAEAAAMVKKALDWAAELQKEKLLDGFALCSDYCFNVGPFLSPAQFGEFVTPYLVNLIRGYRDRGYYVIKHTDGNIMPILDQLVECRPHALHSLDPMAGVDIKVVKELVGDKVALCGNVHCAALQTGTEQDVIDSCEYCLTYGKPGGGYIFTTSNVPFKGMDPKRYELVLSVWKRMRAY